MLQRASQLACPFLTPSPPPPGSLPARHPDQPRQVRAAGGGAGAGAGCQGGGAGGEQWAMGPTGWWRVYGGAPPQRCIQEERKAVSPAAIPQPDQMDLPACAECRAASRRVHPPPRMASSTCCSSSLTTRCEWPAGLCCTVLGHGLWWTLGHLLAVDGTYHHDNLL